jgi:hypothetical protein
MMLKRIGIILAVLLSALFCASCTKSIQPSLVCGHWRSVYEEWKLWEDGNATYESYDYWSGATEESAILRIAKTSFDLFASAESKAFNVTYKDRFGSVQTTASLRKTTITGTNGAEWKKINVKGDRMEL